MNNTIKHLTSTPEPIAFTHKIGSTMYHVNVHYEAEGKKSLEEKVLRMMKNDLHFSEKSDIIKVPQADWLPERGSL